MEDLIDKEENKYLGKDDGFATHTSSEDRKVERKVAEIYDLYEEMNDSQTPKLLREEHITYLLNSAKSLSWGFQSLDASRTWLSYWVLHSLEVLGAHVPSDNNSLNIRTISFLSKCQSSTGGFGGGPNQIPHLAPTYAATNALMICGTETAYKLIDRQKMYQFLLSLKDPVTGHFTMHKDGEIDMRASYCALSVASLLNIMTPELTKGAAEFIGRCQTYEGGLGGYPGNEAHGGYTFCGFAALTILNRTDVVNLPLMLEWVVNKQKRYEGGFMGRTNKLVDSCYSFWQGSLFALLDQAMNISSKPSLPPSDSVNVVDEEESSWLFVQSKLQQYILLCCQDKDGGLRDKPGKSRDLYHTCYSLSGLSIAQHNKDNTITLLGGVENVVMRTHPVYNIGYDKVESAKSYFGKLPLPN